MPDSALQHVNRPNSVELVPAHLRPVLAALVTGATDVSASCRLHISPRTFSRRVSELLDFLGVQTRFQAGLVVASSYWRPGVVRETGPSPEIPPTAHPHFRLASTRVWPRSAGQAADEFSPTS